MLALFLPLIPIFLLLKTLELISLQTIYKTPTKSNIEKTPINKNSMNNKHNKNSLIKNFIEFQLIKIQIGVNNAVKIKKNIEIPSTAKRAGPNTGSIPGIHSNFFIA